MFHLSFIELLLQQCERNVFSFRGSDVLHLCLALSSLVRSQNGDLIPPRLQKLIANRLEALAALLFGLNTLGALL